MKLGNYKNKQTYKYSPINIKNENPTSHCNIHLNEVDTILYTQEYSLSERLCGLMDKAPDFESGDCRFESCHGK